MMARYLIMFRFNNFFLFIIAILLSSCSSPKPTSGVCRSCTPYYVRDEWHYPQNHYEYDEVGLASWYGPKFHGKPKAHGEIYNQYEMTAAHKTLPIPTIAKVTNLETGKSTKVLIDDRGPYVYKGRIIDLSEAAAKEIGVYQKGLAKVRVTALEEESHRFAKHLKQYRKGKCPRGRRWVHIFQQDLAQDPQDLMSSIYKNNVPEVRQLPYTAQKKAPILSLTHKKDVDMLLKTIPVQKQKKQKSSKTEVVSLYQKKKSSKDSDLDHLIQSIQHKKTTKRLSAASKVARKKQIKLNGKVKRLSLAKR